jgi:hypothetical protein
MVGTMQSASSTAAIGADRAVVMRWCGLRRYNAIGRFASVRGATECVRLLGADGFGSSSLSTVAVIDDERINALVGIHSDDVLVVDRAAVVMQRAHARVCVF